MSITGLLRGTALGPGLITGAADDDPSGIATYAQVGAQFGYAMLWTMLFSFPLMVAIQQVSARLGRVTGRGLAANIAQRYPSAFLTVVVCLLLAANIANLGADIGAMGAALQLLIGGWALLYVTFFALLSLTLQIAVPYTRYVSYLKWLTLAVWTYVAAAFAVHVSWPEAIRATMVPRVGLHAGYFTALIAVLGTTLSPYLVFWQASQEVEEVRSTPRAQPLKQAPSAGRRQLRRIKIDTYVGMAVSNLIGFFIILTTSATLHVRGVVDISTAAQAAQALEPLAGPFAAMLFSLGIVGTGLLAVPVLAGSAAYGVGEALHWPIGLERPASHAKRFYAVLGAATLIGMALNFSNINPIRALFWSAVINGMVAVPVMAILMVIAMDRKIMGQFMLPVSLRIGGWLATAVMAVATIGMLAQLAGKWQ